MSNFETFSDNTDNNLQQFDSLTIPKKPFSTKILCIFDGFGLNVNSPNNAISRAKMPNFRRLLKENYWTTLSADGESVGQEAGLVGNSEVGHMNIGGLKLVPQLSFQITKSSQNSFDLDKSITPDQLFDPKKFLENLWNEKIKISSLKKENCPISNLLYKACKICLDEEIPGIEYITHHNYKFSGESYDGWNENFIYLEDFFYVVDSWILPGVNLNYKVVAEMLDNRTNKLDWDYKHGEYWQKYGKTETALWKYLKQAYELACCQTEEELLNFVKNELNQTLPKPKTIHLVGLFSTGCIHSDLRHWVGSIEASLLAGSEKVVLHLMTDGRDSDKKSLVATWQKFTEMLEEKISKSPCREEGDQRSEGVLETRETQNSFSKKVTESWKNKIFLGSVGGRFFGMDRDKNWLRVWDGLSQMFNPWTLSAKDFSGKLSPSEQILIDFIQKKYQIDISRGFTFGKIDDEIKPDTIPLNSKSTILESQLENQIKDSQNGLELNSQKNSQKKRENSNKIKNLDKDSNEEKNDNLAKITKFLQNITDLNYQSEKFDEMIVPTRPVYENLEITQENGQKMFEMTGITKNDTVWLINFRSDRMKQFGQMLCDLNQELGLNLTIIANNSFGLKVETFLTADLDFDENINRFKKMPSYDYQEGQYYPVFKPQTVKNTLAQSISQIPKIDYKKIHFDNELNYELEDKLTTLAQNNWQNWQNINWQTSSFEFIQINLQTATKIATKYNILELQKDLKNPESWLFGHIEMSKNKTRLDFFCVENEKYLGFVQLEKMGEKNYELFVPEDKVSNLSDLLQQFSELVFANLSIKSLYLKQTEKYFEKYKKEIYEAGFEFEKLEIETGCVYSKKSQKESETVIKKQESQSDKTGKLENQKFCTQLHIAETEKYNHVTYFFNGGQDKKWDGEDWIVIPSNKVASHAEIPEMKAREVTDKILEVLGGEELEQETKLKIREMTENDLEEVKKIIIEGWQDSVFFEVDLEFLKQNCERLSFPALTDNNYQKFVCVKNDQLIGYLAVENKAENSGTFWIGDFYIKKEFRKQGVGQFLFDHGLKFIQQNRGQEVFLYLDDANLAATRFYTKVGFIPVKKSEFEWLDKDGKVVATNSEQLMRLEMSKIRSKILKKESVEEIQYAKINSPKKLIENTKIPLTYSQTPPLRSINFSGEKNTLKSGDNTQNSPLGTVNSPMPILNCQEFESDSQFIYQEDKSKEGLEFKDRLTVRAIIYNPKTQKYLWHENINNHFIDTKFILIGGAIKKEEIIQKALLRKLKGETNLDENELSLINFIGKTNTKSQFIPDQQGHSNIIPGNLEIDATFNINHINHIFYIETLSEKADFEADGCISKWLSKEEVLKQDNNLNSETRFILENMDKLKKEAKEKADIELDLSQTKTPQYDYIIVNYANPDMVGHTGDIPASIHSMEFLDAELGRLLEVIERDGHEMIIIADHGNMEFVGEYQKNGKTLTDTEHNPSPVPCIFVGNKWKINNPNLENTKEKFLQNLENLSTQKIANLDLELVKRVLKQKNQVDLSQQENWLSHTKIDFLRSEQLPLWASGALLLGL